MQDVDISNNTASGGVIYAARRSNLTLTNCSISANNGSAVVFAGSRLSISGTDFTSNAAAATVVAPAEFLDRRWVPGPGAYDTVAVISNSSFSDNMGMNGGAVYAGPGSTLRFVSVVFSGNKGYDGGGVFADRDACLSRMVNTTFTDNSALGR
jgi:hypothetical protein